MNLPIFIIFEELDKLDSEKELCKKCNKEVFIAQLYVKDDVDIYHYSCYNYMKSENGESNE